MDLELSLVNCIGYDNSKMKCISDTKVCYLSGSALVEWDLINNEREYKWSSKHGYQKFETNPKQGLLVLVEYGTNPDLYIYKNNQLVKTLSGLIEFEVIDVILSRDGEKMIIIKGCPSYELIIYDLVNERQLNNQSCKIQINESDYLDLQFNPTDNNQFAILNDSHLDIYKLEIDYQISEQVNTETLNDDIQLKYRLKLNSTQLTDNIQMKKMLWDQINNIYLSQDNVISIIKSEDMEVIMTKEMQTVIQHILMTQKHVIVCFKNSYMEWVFKYDPQFINDKSTEPLTMDKYYLFLEGQIINMLYDHFFENIVLSSEDSSVYVLNIKGYNIMEDEEEDQNADKQENNQDEEEDNSNKIECDYFKYGPHATENIIYVKQLKNLDIIFSCTNKGEIQMIDIQSRNVVRSNYFNQNVQVMEMNTNDTLIIMGSQTGCVRILDSRDLTNIQTIQVFKFYEDKTIDFIKFYNNRILIGSKKSKKIHVLYKEDQSDDEYKLQGILYLPSKLVFIQVDTSNSQDILFMMNYLVVQTNQLDSFVEGSNEFDWASNHLKCRKVDQNLEFGYQNQDKIYLIGKDKLIKQYFKCEDDLYDFDLKIKTPPSNPIQEYRNIDMEINQMIGNDRYLITGGKDGKVIIRELVDLEKYYSHQVMSLSQQGVISISINKDNSLISCGGSQGNVFIFNINNVYEYDSRNEIRSKDNQIPYSELNRIEDSEIVIYRQLEVEKMNQQLKEQNQQAEGKQKEQLDQIKQELEQLLAKNQQAEEMEQLERDEFCIDLKKRDQMKMDAEQEQQKMKDQAQKQIQVQQKIFSKIKQQTYDQMSNHLKAINGIKDNIIVYNYQIKITTQKESVQLKKVMEMRKIELTEKYMRMEMKLQELIRIQDLCKKPENYVINVYSGKPEQFVFNDYEKKEEIKEKKGEQQEQKNIKSKNMRQFQGFAVFKNLTNVNLDRDKGLRQKSQEEEQLQMDTQQQINDLQNQLDQKINIDEMQIWDYLYSQLELFSNNQKRNQVVIIQNIIEEIKKEFNKEFEHSMNFRQQQIDSIHEKNKRIKEIQSDLQKEQEVFEAKQNIFDNPEVVLEVNDDEVGIVRYLSKEERKRLEEERLKEEERQRLLQQDDAGIRAIKQMMGGTLQEKKETPLTENLEREEWMDMPIEEMDDDQRAKLREFEVKELKLKEKREQIRKNLTNELLQLQSQIHDICKGFDDRLIVLQKRKLEYDQRINEQYLQIIKLVQSILQGNERVNQLLEMEKVIVEFKDQIEQMHSQLSYFQLYQEQLQENRKLAQDNYGSALQVNRAFEMGKIKKIYNSVFEDLNNLTQRKKEDEQNLVHNQQFNQQLFILDPFYYLELRDICNQREKVFENYIQDIMQKFQTFQMNTEDEQAVSQIIQLLKNKFQVKLQLNEQELKLNNLNEFINYFQNQIEQQQQLYKQNLVKQKELLDHQNKSKSNLEIQIRIKQGMVEIFQDEPVPSLVDAILIPQKHIEQLNKEIRRQGESQIEALDHIKNTKFDVAKAEYDKRKKFLELKQLEVKIGQIQMLKVKKEMQIALQKKDMKLNENDLKNLSEQMEKIKENTEKKISIIKKKEESIQKEIEFTLKENQQLMNQGANLNSTVKQRKEIKDMLEKEKKKSVKDDNNDNEANEKFQSISQARRLHDHVVKQTEEIQLLRDELTKLKNKTFPDFTNQGYPGQR